jgi:serine protease AprX
MLAKSLGWVAVAMLVATVGLAGTVAVGAPRGPFALSPGERPAATGAGWMLVSLAEKADLSGAEIQGSKVARTRYVYERLRAVADRTQPGLVAWLEGRGAQVERFWVDNVLRVRADAVTLALLAQRPEVAWLRPEGRIHLIDPLPPAAPWGPEAARLASLAVVATGVKEINADEVWKMGFKGEGVTVAILDTGADYKHAALKKNYRGYPQYNHDYHWLDAVRDEPAPLDENSHGTHVTGIAVGSDPARQVGVAPAAKWIACRLIEEQSGPDSASLRCLQWVLAPTTLAGTDPKPELAPDVINASWGNELGDGCLAETIHGAIRSVTAAGIVFVAAAGNSGDNCKTVCVPGAYAEAFTVANYDVSARAINASSSRGPVEWPGRVIVKPDIAAPGTNVNSSIPNNRYDEKTGTSMASPHIAGAVALLLSAKPGYRGHPDLVRQALEEAAKKGRPTGRCGEEENGKDNVEGRGVADVKKAVVAALTATVPPSPTPRPTRTPPPTVTATEPGPTATDTPPSTATAGAPVGPTATPLIPHFRIFAPYTARRWTPVQTPVPPR